MKTSTLPHPPADDLIAFAQGLLDSARAAVVEVHLSQCSPCAAEVAAAPDDGFIALVKAAERSAFSDELHMAGTRGTDAAGPKQGVGLDRLPDELREHRRYKVQRLLAAGAMGEVYLALDSALRVGDIAGVAVAIKVLKPELAGNPARKKRFMEEARIAARLRHPNVAQVLHSAMVGDSAYIVMELVSGETLAEIVGHRGPLPVNEACQYVRQAATGLEYASRQGVVHRDVKPHNLMFDPQSGLVKILDFGLGRLVDEHRSGTRLTREGEILGTVNYLSPEQADDSREADVRSDIYSLGCVFFFLLSGFPPFRGKNPLEILNKHQEEAPPSLAALRPDIPAEIVGLVGRMLAKDPAARPQSPGEIAAALKPAAAAGNAVGCGGARRRPTTILPARLISILLSPAVVLPVLTLLFCLLWLLWT